MIGRLSQLGDQPLSVKWLLVFGLLGGGGFTGLQALNGKDSDRVVRLEVKVEHLQEEISEIKTDVKDILREIRK